MITVIVGGDQVMVAQPMTQLGSPGVEFVVRSAQSFSFVEFLGPVTLLAPCHLSDCLVSMGPRYYPPKQAYGVNVQPGAAGSILERVTVRPTDPTAYTADGIGAFGDVTTINCDISGTVDGFGWNGGNWTDTGSRIHDLIRYDVDVNHTDGTHNDGMQGQSLGVMRLTGTSIDVTSTLGTGSLSCLMFNKPASFYGDGLTLLGGSVPVNLAALMTVFELTNSRIGYGRQLIAGQYAGVIASAANRAIMKLAGTLMVDGKPLIIANGA